MLEPNIKKSEPAPSNPDQPPTTIVPNEPADTLAKALNNSKRAIEAANKAAAS
jgi:hypothetical protein